VFTTKTCETSSYKSATANCFYKAGPFEGNGPDRALILLLAGFLAIAFARQSLFHTAFFAGLKIVRMPLNFLNNVLLLDLPFEAV
jgi:hypothetical protein